MNKKSFIQIFSLPRLSRKGIQSFCRTLLSLVLSSLTMPPRLQPEPPPLSEAIAALTNAFNEFRANQDHRHETTLLSIQALQTQFLELQQQQRQTTPSPGSSSAFQANSIPPPKPPKLTLPPFDGSNPLEWVFQANQYFTHYSIHHNNRLNLIANYMSGDALAWFQWLHQNNLLTTWDHFCRDLELRFGPSSFENHQQALFKLRQNTTVHEYQKEFERLCNRVHNLPPNAILDCFISGLRSEIQHEIAIICPTTISQAIGLAKLLKSKNLANRSTHPFPKKPQQSSFPTISSHNTPPLLPAPPTRLALPAPPKPAIPIRRLTQTEMLTRRAKGLCFNCDERFVRGHRCKTSQFLLLLSDEAEPPPENNDTNPDEILFLADPYVTTLEPETTPNPNTLVDNPSPTTPENFHLSFHAVTGHPSPRTLRFQATIHGHNISVLIDSGSSHNILQPRIANFLKLPITDLPPFFVMVGNGAHLHCSGYCNNIPLDIPNHTITVPFYLLPIQGADAVLGVQWLQTLGPFISDFAIPSMQFRHQGRLITLQGTSNSLPTPATFHQITRMLHTDSIDMCHSVSMVLNPPTPQPNNSTDAETDILKSVPPDLMTILDKYSTIFSIPQTLPPSRAHDHQIHLNPTAAPVNIKPYRYPHYQKEAMAKIIAEMLEAGLIRPSTSPYSSPVLLVKKKDGTWRFCVDYRALNSITIKDRFPIPTIDELIDELKGALFFSKIDLRAGYHQIRLAAKDIEKTAFRTFDGHYEFLVMPFGLSNAPSTFQSQMNDLLRPFLRKFTLVFFDDILIYSPTWTDQLLHVEQVLIMLVSQGFYAKLNKCQFGVQSVQYLGHVISHQGVQADKEKLTAIVDWPTPTSLTTLRAFLGLTGFYRKFVQHYATIASPLTDLLKLHKFSWPQTVASAFQQLKKAMLNLPLLTLPDFDIPFEVTTDASGIAIGAVLSQNHKPIAFFSKKLSPRMASLSTYVSELYALTESVKKWRQYLLGHTFKIFTDHKSLKSLMTQTIQTPEQQKWLTKLMGYNYEIHYTPGKDNVVADALSRSSDSSAMPCFTAISSLTFPWLQQLHDFFSTLEGQQLISKITTNTASASKFCQKGGLLYFQDRLFIPKDSGIIPLLL